MLGTLVRAARPLAHANIAPPILFGQALAFWATGHFSWTGFALAHAFGLADHLFVVTSNDYADREADARNRHATPFSGGSRVLPEGRMRPATMRWLAIGSGLAVLAIGIAGRSVSLALPLLAVAAIALMLAYSYPPLRLSYRGGGEMLQGLGVGVVLPMVGLAAQGALDVSMLLYVVPTVLLGLAGNVLTSIPDERPDRSAHKRTLAVRLGGRPARALSVALHLFAAAAGSLALPLGTIAASIVMGIAGVLQLGAVLVMTTDRGSTLRFLILGGATESVLCLGWSLALFLA